MLPPWPGWDGLHPLVIHFPIALLLVSPLFVLLSMVLPKHRGAFAASALAMLVLGTGGAFIAVETGEAAAELATRSDAINAAIESHATLAETTRNVFAGLTVLYVVILALPRFVKALSTRTAMVVAQTVFLGLLVAGNLVLAGTAHRGGLLVHRHGVHAMLPPGS